MKPPPINIKVERERMERDAAARWLAKHGKANLHNAKKRKAKFKGGARR